MIIRSRRVSLTLAATLALGSASSCGDDDDVTTASTNAPGSAVTVLGTAGTAPAQSTTIVGTAPTTTQGGGTECEVLTEQVGSVVDLVSEEAVLDCEVVGGGEPIFRRSIITTSTDGVVVIRVGGGECTLYPSLKVEAQPTEGKMIEVTEGLEAQLACRSMSVGVIGDTTITPRGPSTSFLLDVNSDGTFMVWILDGLVTVDDGAAGCRTVAGPDERLVAGSGTAQREPLDPASLPPNLAAAVPVYGGDGDPPEFDLQERLAAAIEDEGATLEVEGEVVGEIGDIPERLRPFLLGEFAADIAVDLERQVNAPVDAAEPSPSGSGTAPEATSPTESTPPETSTSQARVAVPILVDADGRRWTANFLPDTPARERFEVSLHEALRTGAYGAAHLRDFGSLPDYVALDPDLLGNQRVC